MASPTNKREGMQMSNAAGVSGGVIVTDTHAVPVKVRDLRAGMRIRCADEVYRIISEDSVVDSLATRHATTWNAGRAVDAEVRLLMTDGTWATVTVSGHVYGVAS